METHSQPRQSRTHPAWTIAYLGLIIGAAAGVVWIYRRIYSVAPIETTDFIVGAFMAGGTTLTVMTVVWLIARRRSTANVGRPGKDAQS